MNKSAENIIRDQIAPLVDSGEVALLLGAGFSVVNCVGDDRLPTGEELKIRLLSKCGRDAGPKTSLKDAYQYAQRKIDDFDAFFANCFKVSSVFQWQQKIFYYTWSRIYTTNIDNVLNVAENTVKISGKLAGDYKFFNYVDEGLVSAMIGTIPVINIHGTCLRPLDGFIFSSLDYAKISSKVLDWHNDLAAKMIAGGLVVIGNQLDESDIDKYIAHRNNLYNYEVSGKNWIVSPDPDEVKSDNWRAAGFEVIDATAEEFFNVLYAVVKPKSIGDIFISNVPSAKKAVFDVKAMTWFKSAFRLSFDDIEKARNKKGILRHFITGADPEWFYIVNDVHAQTGKGSELTAEIANLMLSNAVGVGVLHVIGPSGSGKTTAIRNSLRDMSRSYKFIYEFDDNQAIDQNLLKSVIDNFNEKSIFIFYSASEYYYVIKELADKQRDRKKPYCLFVLEDRSSEYKKNKRQISGSGVVHRIIEFGELRIEDGINIARKIESAGLNFPKFSEKDIKSRAQIILDKEKGFGGDLLSALFSLTTHENFEQKIYQDYQSAPSGLPRRILDLVAVLHSLGYSVPIDYISGALGERFDDVFGAVQDDLAGVVLMPHGSGVVRCRHRVIANYYFDNCIGGKGDPLMLIGLLEYLSRQFSIDDIKLHPLPYKIYRDVVSFEFIYEKYFSNQSRDDDAESVYHSAQSFYGRDGIFWLHYGRYYRKIGKLESAIDCFRTGLDFYDSFQTRHSLGTALLELFLRDGDESCYSEGVSVLEAERRSGGSSDPYPTTTLLSFMMEVLKRNPAHVDAGVRAKDCFNKGLRYFRNDEYFSRVSADYGRFIGVPT